MSCRETGHNYFIFNKIEGYRSAGVLFSGEGAAEATGTQHEKG